MRWRPRDDEERDIGEGFVFHLVRLASGDPDALSGGKSRGSVCLSIGEISTSGIRGPFTIAELLSTMRSLLPRIGSDRRAISYTASITRISSVISATNFSGSRGKCSQVATGNVLRISA